MLISLLFSFACNEEIQPNGTNANVPNLESLFLMIDRDTAIGTKIGSVTVLNEGDSPISEFILEDESNFTINALGEIKTKTSFLDEDTLSYSLSVSANNDFGLSESVEVLVEITEVEESKPKLGAAGTPTLGDFEAYVHETAEQNTVIGVIPVMDSGFSPITSYTLSDERYFEINTLGELSLKSKLSYEATNELHLQVFASNDEGDGLKSDITIHVNDPSVTTTLCEGSELGFEDVSKQVKSWSTTIDETTMATVLHWAEVKDATGYKLVITPEGGETIQTSQSSQVGTSFAMQPTILQAGFDISPNVVGGYDVLSSSQLRDGSEVEVQIIAIDGSEVLVEFDPIMIRIGREFYSATPNFLTTQYSSDGLRFEWCGIDHAGSYEIRYGLDADNLDYSITELSPGVMSQTIAELSDYGIYHFSIAAVGQNTQDEFTEAISTSLNEDPQMIDLSVDKVTFNQAVQIDLADRHDLTPVIANKSGVLRVFVNSLSPHQSQKVEVKLGGSYQGNDLEPITKEVALRHTPFAEADSVKGVVHFELNDPNWLREGTSFFIELDPNNKLAEFNEKNNRYPDGDSLRSFHFKERSAMRIKLFPVTTNRGSYSGYISSKLVTEVEGYLKSIYPLSEVEVLVGEAFSSEANINDNMDSWGTVLNELAALKNMQVENDPLEHDVFYYGVIDCQGHCGAGLGLATLSRRASSAQLVGMGRVDTISTRKFAEVLAHELGHNHGRKHVDAIDSEDCWSSINHDLDYPFNLEDGAHGQIGKTGYHHLDHRLIDKESFHDMMSYCEQTWISNYTYSALYDFKDELDHFYQQVYKNDYEQQGRERSEGLMVYGKLIKKDDGTVESELDFQHSMKHIPSAFALSRAEYSAVVKFADSRKIVVPVIMNELDHSQGSLFQLFIPSLDDFEAIEFEGQ